MSSENSFPKLPILLGSANWREWHRAIAATAALGGFAAPIFNPTKNVADEKSGLTADAATQREMKASGLILRTISPHIADELFDAVLSPSPPKEGETGGDDDPTPVTAAADQFNYLKAKYEKSDAVSVIFEWQKLITTRLVDDGTLEAQLDKLWEIRTCCALHGIKIDDYLFAGTILTQLPELFNTVRDTLLSLKDITELKSSEVRTKILEKQVRSTQDPANNALGVTQKKGKQGKKPPPDKPCHYCGKAGHWQAQCRKKKKDAANKPGSSNQNTGGGGTSSLNVHWGQGPMETSDYILNTL